MYVGLKAARITSRGIASPGGNKEQCWKLDSQSRTQNHCQQSAVSACFIPRLFLGRWLVLTIHVISLIEAVVRTNIGYLVMTS